MKHYILSLFVVTMVVSMASTCATGEVFMVGTLHHGLFSLYKLDDACAERFAGTIPVLPPACLTIRISDRGSSYDLLICDASTYGIIVIRSHNKELCDYCLHWGSMVGVDMSQYALQNTMKTSCGQNQHGVYTLSITIPETGSIRQYELPKGNACMAVLAWSIPATIATKIATADKPIALVDACRLGIIMTKKQEDAISLPNAEDSEAEFDDMLNNMFKDGTIALKEPSPWMTALKTVGTKLFMQYLHTKAFLKKFFAQSNTQA